MYASNDIYAYLLYNYIHDPDPQPGEQLWSVQLGWEKD